MKKLTVFFIIMIFALACSNRYKVLKEKAVDLSGKIIKAELGTGVSYRGKETLVDSAFSQLLFVPEVQSAAQEILYLQGILDQVDPTTIDGFDLQYINETLREIHRLQNVILEANKSFKSGEFCGWKITHSFYADNGEFDRLHEVVLYANYEIDHLLVEVVSTDDRHCIEEVIQQCLEK